MLVSPSPPAYSIWPLRICDTLKPIPDTGSTPKEELPFESGTLLAGRFRIVRPIGRGGMGVVYEAFDEHLDRRVALKCARPGHLHRLPPEARAAREVSHYNVCKVHDLHAAPSPSGDIHFLSMEFIDGQTLAGRIQREGPLPPSEARDLARQICAGLTQAHRQGVVHGDLKCANILLARSPEGGTRAVVTDFGLASLKTGDEAPSGAAGGTYDYMAPELFLGEPATIASDLYALGILLHVMLTGHPPERLHPLPVPAPPHSWTTGSVASTITLGHPVSDADWQRQLSDLPAPWKRIVARCTAARPGARYPSAASVQQALRPRRLALKAAAGLAAAAVMAVGYSQWPSPLPAADPVRLTVLPFSISGDSVANAAGVALEVADRLTGARSNFTVIYPREAERNQVTTVEEAQTRLGATHVLRTSLHPAGQQIAAAATLLDARSGRVLNRLNGTYRDPAGLAKALTATVTTTFQLRRRVPAESVSTAAYPDYIQGIDLLHQDNRNNADAAIGFLTRAVQLDPTSALTYAGLAEAQAQKFANAAGQDWLTRAEANAAKARSINPDSVPVLLVSGFVQQQHGWYEPAIRDFTRATTLTPDNSETWRRLAVCYEQAGRIDEAIATYRKASQAQPGYYRHYLDFGNFYLNRSQYPQAEEQYRRVIAAAPALRSGHMNLGIALLNEGRFDQAEQSLLAARRFLDSPAVMLNLGALYYAEERFPEAAALFEKCLASGPPTATRYRDLGDALRHLNRAREAADAYQRGRALAEQDIARNPRRAASRVLVGLLSAAIHDAPRARSELSQALALEPENTVVMRDAVIAYEMLRQRPQSLAVLANAPRSLLEELGRQPDVRELRQDPRFQKLVQSKTTQ